ncbi:hypothetical protein E3J62_00675 [candidate division TA06 bacterium]|uniref:SPOR domain-containing protein n=1 Tax=candidate division TA06 bacterium TaxID=2250710 RepID=A0A523UYY4_UNCT6|nr:MAG: hypothetical protein E3J62_00675 [candidate division TA06 bacterium]
MATLEELNDRVGKLEKHGRGRVRFFFQYLLFPVLIVVIGFWFNLRLERAKQEFKHVELELKRIQAAHQMLNELFSGIPERAFIAERLITKIVDKQLCEEIHKIVEDYYLRKLEESASKGDLETVEEIAMAAEGINSQASQKILQALEEPQFQIVAESFGSQEEADRRADQLRRKGYECEVRSTRTGKFEVIIGELVFKEAILERKKGIKDGLVLRDSPIQRAFEHRGHE